MTTENQTVREFSLHPKQWDAYNFKTLYGATICGKRSGKTFVGALWVQKKISESATPVTGIIAAPTYKLLEQATLDTFFGLFPEYRRYWQKQKNVIELPRGDTIFIRSADEPNSLEGITADFAWLDEAGQMKREVWRIIRARVSTTKGQVFITSSPYTMNWLYSELFVPWQKGEDKEISIFKWPTIDNPVFKNDTDASAFIDAEVNRLSPEEFAREYLGEFTHLEGLIWDLHDENFVEQSAFLERILRFPDKIIAGLDWGFHHPTAIVVMAVKDATYYVIDEWRESGKTTAEIVEKAKELQKKYNITLWFPDPAEPDRIEELKRAHLSIGDTNKDVVLGLSYVASLFREKRLFINKACHGIIDEASQYVWQSGVDGKPGKECPVKSYDDLCDALRYGAMGYRPYEPKNKNLPPVDKLPTAIVNLLNSSGGAIQKNKWRGAL